MEAQRAPADLPDGFGVAVVREDGKWRCAPMRSSSLKSLTAAETELRELRSAGAVFGLLDVDDEFSGTVVEKMNQRKAEMTDMRPSGGGKTRITFSAPSRGLIGYHGEFLSDTRGTGIMNRLFEKYGPHRGKIEGRPNGVLISNGAGEAVEAVVDHQADAEHDVIVGGPPGVDRPRAPRCAPASTASAS